MKQLIAESALDENVAILCQTENFGRVKNNYPEYLQAIHHGNLVEVTEIEEQTNIRGHISAENLSKLAKPDKYVTILTHSE